MIDQTTGFEAQFKELEGQGRKNFTRTEIIVGVRPQLEAALESMRESNVLVVTKLDRLARSGPTS